MRLKLKHLFLYVSLLSFGPIVADANAQSFAHSLRDLPVIRQASQDSSDTLFSEKNSSDTSPSRTFTLIFRYRPSSPELRPGAGTYDVKPSCATATVRKIPVVYPTRELNEFDLTYYDLNNKHQRATAETLNRPTVPYLEGDQFNPWREKPNIQQDLGRFFDIRCLPTRVHFIEEGGNYFEVYREGTGAWQ